MDLDRAHPHHAIERQQPHRVAHGYCAAPRRAGDHRAGAWEREHAVDREPEEVLRRAFHEISGDVAQRCTQLIQALPGGCRDGYYLLPRYPARAQPLCDLATHHLEPLGLHQVALGKYGDAAGHSQQLDDREVLLGLRHDSFVGGDHEQGHVDPGCAGEHVPDEPLVARHVHDARFDSLVQR